MIYGNHNKRKGDIVKLARWDEELIKKAAEFNKVSEEVIAEKKFVIVWIDFYRRQMKLNMVHTRDSEKIPGPAFVVVNLDETNIIRVGRLENKE